MPDASITNTGLADLPVAMSEPPMLIKPATSMAATSLTEEALRSTVESPPTIVVRMAYSGLSHAPRQVDDVGRNCDRRDIDLTPPHSNRSASNLIAEPLTALSAPQ
ncbi:hypothetical protein QA641_37545 [Bradyrhizobium sp. CB1650]|uniref:hypothetical protein n=1 Tax=Bradyrhizobium sp. CB1650 TaxID=3039153 RepID=UPI002435D4FA|nr:hypothetical protein [Bradyrhizobium sp. CB1650]WGD51152.1 hypothetical protein QA641_37545 [Bradyrhizobium sp. CB1650]